MTDDAPARRGLWGPGEADTRPNSVLAEALDDIADLLESLGADDSAADVREAARRLDPDDETTKETP